MTMGCMQMKRQAVRLIMYATMEGRIHFCVVPELFSISVSYTAIIGTRSIVEGRANTIARMLIWAARNLNQAQHKQVPQFNESFHHHHRIAKR